MGLWEHQKYFVKLAFDAHRGPHGARFVLADQVGLGKTLQLAMAAQLMALVGDRPVLALAPKSLVWQWQGELDTLLGLPSAVWDGQQWVDERGVEHPGAGAEAIRRCPRRVGIVSTGLITRGSEAADMLAHMRFECVILDEAHRARRRSRGRMRSGRRTRTISCGSCGRSRRERKACSSRRRRRFSSIRLRPTICLTHSPVARTPCSADREAGGATPGPRSIWCSVTWPRPPRSRSAGSGGANPLPPRSEGRDFQILRNSLELADEDAYAPGSAIDDLRPPDRQRIMQGFDGLVERHNPYIRTIVLRTREYLETTIDPETNEPYLTPVTVRLHGDSDADAIRFPPFLEEAYHAAEDVLHPAR